MGDVAQQTLSGWVFQNRIQVLAVLASMSLLALIVELVRKARLKEAYALLWLCSAMVLLFFSFWRNGLELLARVVGIAYAPAALFLLLIVSILLILIQFSVVVSKLSDQQRILAQELALTQAELRRLHSSALSVGQEQRDA